MVLCGVRRLDAASLLPLLFVECGEPSPLCCSAGSGRLFPTRKLVTSLDSALPFSLFKHKLTPCRIGLTAQFTAWTVGAHI